MKLLLLLLLGLQPVFVYSLDDSKLILGLEQYKNKQYKKSFETLMPLAKANNVDAQLYIGTLYFKGRGISQNFKKAFEWYSKAAKQGDVKALNMLGDMYSAGKGVKADREKALKYYLQSAEKGSVAGNYSVALLYDRMGTYEKAEKYYLFAARKGSKAAQLHLGSLQAKPLKKYKEAKYWLLPLAEEGDLEAMDSLAIALVHLDNEKEAIAWLKKAAKQNYVPSLGNLGDVYCQAEDYKNAEKWYSRAVKAGDKEFLINLGIVYLIRGSSNEAEKCFWEAAKYDMRKSYYLLGFLEVMKYNYPQAIKYFKKSLDRNKYFKSAYVLGLIYHDFLKDRKLAEKYYEEAIKHGIYYARPRLAWLLFQKGEKERSRMMIREAIKYSEKYDQGGVDFFFYSKVFIGMKRTKEALLMLKEAKKAYPGSVAIRLGLGDIYFLIGKYREAKKEYLKALEFNKKGCTFDKNQTEDLIRKCLNQVDEKLRH